MTGPQHAGHEAVGVRRSPLIAALTAAVVATTLTVAPRATSTAPDPIDVISLVRVDTPTRADRQRLADLGVDLSEHAGDGFVDVVLHGAEDAARLAAAGFTWTVRIPDLVAREREIAAADRAYAADENAPTMPSGRRAYRTLADYEWDLRELAKRNPDLVKLIRLPHETVEGRSVLGVEIAREVWRLDGRPTFAVMGLHHAREWPSGEHTIEFAFDLVQSFRAGDARTVDLLGRARVVAVPVVNPDGFVASMTAARPVDGRELSELEGAQGDESTTYLAVQLAVVPAYKRKNCRTVDGQPTPSGACLAPGARQLGVDPNRNYAALWGGAGSSAFPGDDLYRGPAPFSEPETQNIRELVSSRQVTVLVTNHTFAGLVLRAPGVKDQGVTVDEPAMKALGQAMADANGSLNQLGYELYDTTGTTEDWSYGATGGYGFTFELAVPEFHPPFEETVADYLGTGKLAGRGNREAFYIALAAAADPAHHSVIATDAPPGAILRLRKSFDTSTSPVRTAETQFTDDPGSAGAVRTVRDHLDSRILSTGHDEWHVNPSTRPAVMERRVYDVGESIRRVDHDGDVPPVGEHIDVPFRLAPEDAAERLTVALDWAEPDDLDLEVLRVVDGKPQPVASSGNPPLFKESVTIDAPEPGDYLLRVVNYQSMATRFSLTAELFAVRVTHVHPALVPYEEWTLSCERPDGRVLETRKVLVSRGDRVVIDLSTCRERW